MTRPSPPLPCRRAFPCSPPFIALRNAHPRYVRRAPPVGSAWVSDLNRLRSFRRSLSGPFEGLTSLRLGQPPLGRRRERSGIIGAIFTVARRSDDGSPH